MPRQLHSAPAAAAMTIVICIASVAFMIFVLLPGASFPNHAIPVSNVGRHILNLTRAVGFVVTLGYATGIIGWLAVLSFKRDGMHRMASMSGVRQRY
jgi:hypothetical protein